MQVIIFPRYPVFASVEPMHIVHVITSLSRQFGGTSTFVAELANKQSGHAGNRVTVVTEELAEDALVLSREVTTLRLPRFRIAGWLNERALSTTIDILHVHALWHPFTHAFMHASAVLGLPAVLAPHGMLEPNALRLKRLKKRLALLAYQRRDLRTADFLHVTALQEAETLRSLGLRQPIFVAPPGLDLPAEHHVRSWNKTEVRTALYFSRIHPKKNLLGLLDAWAAVRPTGWMLRIVGPDDGFHTSAVHSRIDDLRLQDAVSLEKPVYGEHKHRIFSTASLFVLPSFSENFGIVVAEALAHGVPVITTHGTPWKQLVEADCGWWVSAAPESLAATLREATHTTDDRLREMGLRGRDLVAQQYQWASVNKRLSTAYRWAVGRGPQPDCVIL